MMDYDKAYGKGEMNKMAENNQDKKTI